jgi:hypothetical protein
LLALLAIRVPHRNYLPVFPRFFEWCAPARGLLLKFMFDFGSPYVRKSLTTENAMSENLKDKAEDAGHKIAEKANDAARKVGDKAHEAKEWVKDKAQQAGNKVEETAEAAKKKIHEATK